MFAGWRFDLGITSGLPSRLLGNGGAMPNFEQMRISLAPREPSPLFGDQEALERSREKFLVDAFAERRDFLPYKGSAKISFLPIKAPEGYVAGYFGRQARCTEDLIATSSSCLYLSTSRRATFPRR